VNLPWGLTAGRKGKPPVVIGLLGPGTGPPVLTACVRFPFFPQISTPGVWGIFYVGLLLSGGYTEPFPASPSSQAPGPGVLMASEFTTAAVKSVESARIARAGLQTSELV
jgi:hypothetical protein